MTELICHPGYADAELLSSYGRVRNSELETLCDPRVRDALDDEGIRLVSFRNLPALQSDGGGERDPSPWRP